MKEGVVGDKLLRMGEGGKGGWKGGDLSNRGGGEIQGILIQ